MPFLSQADISKP